MEQRQITLPTIPDRNLLQSYHKKLVAWTLSHPEANHDQVTQQARKIAKEMGI